MKRSTLIRYAATLVAIPLSLAIPFLLFGCVPNGPSADPRNATVAEVQGSMSTDPPDNHVGKSMVAAPQSTRAYENGFLIDTDVNGSTVNIPSYWEVVSVQRHGLPLGTKSIYEVGDSAVVLSALNTASERLSHMSR